METRGHCVEKLSQTVALKLTKLQKRFESFLDNDFENNNEEAERAQAAFESSRDISLVRGLALGLPEDHIDRAIVLFSRLSLLFDAGVLIENNDGCWLPQAIHYKGVSKPLAGNRAELKIPPMPIMSVLKTNSKTVLEKLNLKFLDPKNETCCLLIKISPDFAFILFSKLPDIWLKDHVENVTRALFSGLAD
jgi:hypothetical protein